MVTAETPVRGSRSTLAELERFRSAIHAASLDAAMRSLLLRKRKELVAPIDGTVALLVVSARAPLPRPPGDPFPRLRLRFRMEPVTTPKLAPYLLVQDAAGLGQFVQDGIGGTPGLRVLDQHGKVNHLEMRVADSLVMIAEAPHGRPTFPAMLHLYVPDADAAYARAIAAGATSVRAPIDAEDGRRGGVRDSWGNEWWFTRAFQ